MKIICPKSADFRGYHAVKTQWPRTASNSLRGHSKDSKQSGYFLPISKWCYVSSGATCQIRPGGSRFSTPDLSKSNLTGRALAESKLLTDTSIHSKGHWGPFPRSTGLLRDFTQQKLTLGTYENNLPKIS